MPSNNRKPRKANKSKYADPKTGEFRHTDGDRRRRRGASAKEAIKNKKLLRESSSPLPEDGGAEQNEAGGADA